MKRDSWFSTLILGAILFSLFSTKPLSSFAEGSLIDRADTVATGETLPDTLKPYSENNVGKDRMPSFRGGGPKRFMRWVADHLEYPDDARIRRVEGVVEVSFVVGRDGTIAEQDISIIRSPDPALSLAVFNLLRNSPQWEPAVQDGVYVRVKYTIPVTFRLPRERVSISTPFPGYGTTPIPGQGNHRIDRF